MQGDSADRVAAAAEHLTITSEALGEPELPGKETAEVQCQRLARHSAVAVAVAQPLLVSLARVVLEALGANPQLQARRCSTPAAEVATTMVLAAWVVAAMLAQAGTRQLAGKAEPQTQAAAAALDQPEALLLLIVLVAATEALALSFCGFRDFTQSAAGLA
jgi:hypothetical protein